MADKNTTPETTSTATGEGYDLLALEKNANIEVDVRMLKEPRRNLFAYATVSLLDGLILIDGVKIYEGLRPSCDMPSRPDGRGGQRYICYIKSKTLFQRVSRAVIAEYERVRDEQEKEPIHKQMEDAARDLPPKEEKPAAEKPAPERDEGTR